jgi:hypothetical protein
MKEREARAASAQNDRGRDHVDDHAHRQEAQAAVEEADLLQTELATINSMAEDDRAMHDEFRQLFVGAHPPMVVFIYSTCLFIQRALFLSIPVNVFMCVCACVRVCVFLIVWGFFRSAVLC